jgi:hypothetical protein
VAASVTKSVSADELLMDFTSCKLAPEQTKFHTEESYRYNIYSALGIDHFVTANMFWIALLFRLSLKGSWQWADGENK